MSDQRQLWECKIGVKGAVTVPNGADFPMRRAVEAEFVKLTGQHPEYIFSGWGSQLEETELAVVEERLPDPSKTPQGKYNMLRAALLGFVGLEDDKGQLIQILEQLHAIGGNDPDALVAMKAVVALIETHE